MGHKPRKRAANPTPLDKHRRDGSRLDPPFAVMPGMTPSSWLDDVLPDMLWAALIVDGLEREHALAVFRKLAAVVHDAAVSFPDGLITHSALAEAGPATVKAAVDDLCGDRAVASVLSPLRLLPELPAYDGWASACEPLTDDPAGWTSLASAVATSFNHQSQAATDCRWIVVVAKLVSGNMTIHPDQARQYLEYPNVGDMRVVRPSIRATEMAFRSMSNPPKWPEAFWQFCLKSTECGPFYNYAPRHPDIQVGITAAQLAGLTTQIRESFRSTMEHTRVDSKRDAVFGLCAYSAALLAEMMRPGASTSITARSSLRTLTETAITLAYLLKKDDPGVWQQFRNYGVGKAKLSYMKQERSASPSFVDTGLLEALANEDYWEEYTSIELGHWRGKDLRRLAEATGTKDLYDTYYDWTSQHGHGHWGAIRESQFVVCMNPLHRFHRVLADSTLPLGDIIPDAAIVMDRILELVRRAYPDAHIDPLSAAVGDDPSRV